MRAWQFWQYGRVAETLPPNLLMPKNCLQFICLNS